MDDFQQSSDGFRPVSAPIGVVPADLIIKNYPEHRRKRGRPPILPTQSLGSTASSPRKSSSKVTKPSSSSGRKHKPISKGQDVGSNNSDASGTLPARTVKRTRLDAPVAADLASDKVVYNGTPLTIDHSFDDWMEHYHHTPDSRLVGDMIRDTDDEEESSFADAESDDEFRPCRVPGVRLVNDALRPMQTPLSADDGYERKEIRIHKLMRFFEELDLDLNLVSHVANDQLRFRFIDGPGLRPADIRARRFEVRVPNGLARNNPNQRVWRVKYRCNGACRTSHRHDHDKPPALSTKDNINHALAGFASRAYKRWAERRRRARNRSESSDQSEASEGSRKSRVSRTQRHQKKSLSRSKAIRVKVVGSETSADDDEGGNSDDDDDLPSSPTPHSRRKALPLITKPIRKSTDVRKTVAQDDVYDSQDSETDIDYDATPTKMDTAEENSDPDVDDTDAADDSSDEDEDEDQEKSPPRKERNACESMVVIEMTAKQCRRGRCTVILQRPEWHPRAPKSSLRYSRHLHLLLHEAAMGFGMTVGRLTAWYSQHILKHDSHAKWLATNYPHRLPSPKDYRAAVVAALKSNRIHRSPLVAIEILATRHPESFIAAEYPSVLGGDIKMKQINTNTRLQCVIAPRWALMAAILQVERMGMFLDSSWRNKNAFRCPLSFLVTINQYHRMIPLAAMVSNHADADAYTFMLREFAKAVVRTAQDFLDGKFEYQVEGVSQEEIREQCASIVETGLSPAFMMIDASDAERIAIKRVFDVPIRLCQFHFMHAIRARIKRFFAGMSDIETLTSNVLEAIRRCQRCPSVEEWDSYYALLGQEVTRIRQDDGTVWTQLKAYLDREWFSDEWRSMIIDYGLPYAAVTRDGPWSTNNYVEASFRTFDRVFLGCRANKRLDRLLAVLIINYFPFYENIPLTESRADPMLQRQLFRGLHRWETDCIRPCARSAVPDAQRAFFGDVVYCVNPARRDKTAYQPHFCGRRAGSDREFCTCQYMSSTGKRCLHLWAMVTYDLCGSVSTFEEHAAVIDEFLKKVARSPAVRQHKHSRMEFDDRRDFREYWGKDIDKLPKLASIDLNSGVPVVVRDARTTTTAQLDKQPAKISNTPQQVSSSDPHEHEGIDKSAPSDLEVIRDLPVIGRRNEVRQEGIRREPDTESDPRGWSQALPGRPSLIRPLDPRRTASTRKADAKPVGQSRSQAKTLEHLVNDTPKPIVPEPTPLQQLSILRSSRAVHEGPDRNVILESFGASQPIFEPSTLSLPKVRPSSLNFVRGRPVDQTVRLRRPVGIRNTGVDCYALSLLQILWRTDLWSQSFAALVISGPEISGDPVVALLRSLRTGLEGAEPPSFPLMRRTLTTGGVVESEHAQVDPDELLEGLNRYLDRTAPTAGFGRAFQFTIISAVVCPRCRTRRVVRDECGVHRSLLVPVGAASNLRASVGQMIANSLQVGNTREHICDSLECRGIPPYKAKAESFLQNGPPILHVHLAWPTKPNETHVPSNASLLRVDHNIRGPFDIPLHLRLIATFRAGPPPPIRYVLRGIICRQGSMVSQGHYIAIVGSDRDWWIIDDDRVRHTSNPATEAFQDGRFPVHLIYEISQAQVNRPARSGASSVFDASNLRQRATLSTAVTTTTGNEAAVNSAGPFLPDEEAFGGASSLLNSHSRASSVVSRIESSRPANLRPSAPQTSANPPKARLSPLPPTKADAAVPKPDFEPAVHAQEGLRTLETRISTSIPPNTHPDVPHGSTNVNVLDFLLSGTPGRKTAWAAVRQDSKKIDPRAQNLPSPAPNWPITSTRRREEEGYFPSLELRQQSPSLSLRSHQSSQDRQMKRVPDATSHKSAGSQACYESPQSKHVNEFEGIEDDDLDPYFVVTGKRWRGAHDNAPSYTYANLHDSFPKPLFSSPLETSPFKGQSSPFAPEQPEYINLLEPRAPFIQAVQSTQAEPAVAKPSLIAMVDAITPEQNPALSDLIEDAKSISFRDNDSSGSYEPDPASPVELDGSEEPDSVSQSEWTVQYGQGSTGSVSELGSRNRASVLGTTSQRQARNRKARGKQVPPVRPSYPQYNTAGLDFNKSWQNVKTRTDAAKLALDRYAQIIWRSNGSGPAPDSTLATSNMISAMEGSYLVQIPPVPEPLFTRLKDRAWLYHVMVRDDPTSSQTSALSTGNEDTELQVEDFKTLITPAEWWNDRLINALVFCARDRLKRESPTSVNAFRFIEFLLPYRADKDGMMQPSLGHHPWGPKKPPWIALGLDRSWRDVVSLAVVSTSNQTHFAAVAIFGPARLVVPFDGTAGMYDCESLALRWTSLLRNRLRWEYQQGWVSAEENDGWIFAPNNKAMRDGLGWVQQVDSHNCGPFAAAAVIMILQGIKPTAANLGLRTPSPLGASWRLLRQSLAMLLIGESIHFATHKVANGALRYMSSSQREAFWVNDRAMLQHFLTWKRSFRRMYAQALNLGKLDLLVDSHEKEAELLLKGHLRM